MSETIAALGDTPVQHQRIFKIILKVTLYVCVYPVRSRKGQKTIVMSFFFIEIGHEEFYAILYGGLGLFTQKILFISQPPSPSYL